MLWTIGPSTLVLPKLSKWWPCLWLSVVFQHFQTTPPFNLNQRHWPIWAQILSVAFLISGINSSWFVWKYRISLVIRRIIFLPKQSQRSRSILKDGSRSLALFRKSKIGIIAKFHRTDLVLWSHSRGTKTLSYSRINTVHINKNNV